ncbi:MAG: IS1595 family transposase [Acidobacteriota bacterium]|nr:IS1595 family transposase [Acidobacteriota bacterium]
MAKKKKAPGRSNRKGLTLLQIFRMFPDDKTAEGWFITQRWPQGVACLDCGSMNVQARPTRKPQPFRCRDCRVDFSVKTGTLMQGSNLGLRVWAIAIYLHATGIKGTSSMKLHRDLGITQKTAWHLMHRIRGAWEEENPCPFRGPVEVDETYLGGKESNRHYKDKLDIRGGTRGKTAVIGIKDRDSNQVSAKVIPDATKRELRGAIEERTEEGVKIFTDQFPAYKGLPNREAVAHNVGEYVRGQAHTNGIESFWALLKRGYYGTYHKMSPRHVGRYIREFEGRHNVRGLDTIEQMRIVARRLEGRRLRYRDLTR